MRVRRAVTLTMLVACFALTAWLVVLGLPHSEANPAASTSQGGSGLPPAPNLDSEPGANVGEQGSPVTLVNAWIWTGALVAGAGTVGTFLAFRTEVRKEKDVLHARQDRDDYRRELKRYNDQLQGPPRLNT